MGESREYQIKQGCAYLIEVGQVMQSYPWADKKRVFVEHDNEELNKTLKDVKYSVEVLRIVNSKKELLKRLESIHTAMEGANGTECDSLIIVISGYGDEGIVYCNGGEVAIFDVLLALFKGDKCQNLAGKPKLFLMQTCNYIDYPYGVAVQPDAPTVTSPAKSVRRIPSEADFAFVQCQIPGALPWRDDIRGSMFFTQLCQHVKQRDPVHGITLNQVLTRTRCDLDARLMKEHEDIYSKSSKKLPLMTSTLTKTFRFTGK